MIGQKYLKVYLKTFILPCQPTVAMATQSVVFGKLAIFCYSPALYTKLISSIICGFSDHYDSTTKKSVEEPMYKVYCAYFAHSLLFYQFIQKNVSFFIVLTNIDEIFFHVMHSNPIDTHFLSQKYLDFKLFKVR